MHGNVTLVDRFRYWRRKRSVGSVENVFSEAELRSLHEKVRLLVWRRDWTEEAILDYVQNCGLPPKRRWIQLHPTYPAFARRIVQASVRAWTVASKTWPDQTDNDRLTRVFEQLTSEGILALENCGISTNDGGAAHGEELQRRIETGDHADDGVHRWVFYHQQDVESAIRGEGLMIAFGALDVETAELLDGESLRVGRRTRQLLEEQGFVVEWDETVSERLRLEFTWQRREVLPSF